MVLKLDKTTALILFTARMIGVLLAVITMTPSLHSSVTPVAGNETQPVIHHIAP